MKKKLIPKHQTGKKIQKLPDLLELSKEYNKQLELEKKLINSIDSISNVLDKQPLGQRDSKLYDYRDSLYNKLDQSRKIRNEVGPIIGELTLNKYKGTEQDPILEINWTNGNEYELLKDLHIRETPEVVEYFKSYINSPGFNRILSNLDKWWTNRYPYHKYYTSSEIESTKKYYLNIKFPIVYSLDMYSDRSWYRPWNHTAYVGQKSSSFSKNKSEHLYEEALGHELSHGVSPIYYNGLREALDMNLNTKKNNHDEYRSEKMADLWGLRYLLYKEGIYDSRSEKDITTEEIQKLRDKYPNLRLFKQMNNEQLLFQLNNVAQNNTYSNIYYAKSGIKILQKGNKFNYPLVDTPTWAKLYFKNNPNISGMAIGGGMNRINGDRLIILNPYTDYNKDSVLKNERLRHYFDESNFKLPNITKEQMNKYKGTPYEGDSLNIGRTEASRYLSGDKHLLTEDQIKYIEGINIPQFKKGGIHIKKENRGKFTKYCDGKVTQECIDKAKKSGNKKLIKRAVFAENSRKWKHESGAKIHKPFGNRSILDNGWISTKELKKKHLNGGLILKFQNPATPVKKLDINGLRNDPEYKKNFNWKMYDKDLEILQDSLIARGADFPERVAVFSQVIPESGGSPAPHGNGAYGIIGFRGSRAENLPEDTPGQVHVLMNGMYDNPTAKDWTHGGVGTGVQTGKEMRDLFLNTVNSTQATKALMKGYVRPESSEWLKRINFAKLLKKYMVIPKTK